VWRCVGGSLRAGFQPAPEGFLTLLRRPPEQDVLNTDIFIQIRPVNALTLANQSSVTPLFRHSVQKPGIPSERH
jgi:hypothetical protein